jgi:hypothetical protein
LFSSTITMFAVFGTVISAAFCAFGIYFMGQVALALPSRALLPLPHTPLSASRPFASARPCARHDPSVLRYLRGRHVCGGCCVRATASARGM